MGAESERIRMLHNHFIVFPKDELRKAKLTDESNPNLTDGGWWKALPELLRAGRLGRRLHALDETLRQELLDLFTVSAAEYLDRWFESAPIKALFGFDGVVGNYASPYTPGSAYVLLHHVFGEVNGKKGAWGHAIGGMGAISQAIASAARLTLATLRSSLKDSSSRMSASVKPSAPWPTLSHRLAYGVAPISGLLFKPSFWTAGERYPVIDYIYGGPQMANVPHRTASRAYLEAASLAELGFIVAIIDGRGTPERNIAAVLVDHGFEHLGQLTRGRFGQEGPVGPALAVGVEEVPAAVLPELLGVLADGRQNGLPVQVGRPRTWTGRGCR